MPLTLDLIYCEGTARHAHQHSSLLFAGVLPSAPHSPGVAQCESAALGMRRPEVRFLPPGPSGAYCAGHNPRFLSGKAQTGMSAGSTSQMLQVRFLLPEPFATACVQDHNAKTHSRLSLIAIPSGADCSCQGVFRRPPFPRDRLRSPLPTGNGRADSIAFQTRI